MRIEMELARILIRENQPAQLIELREIGALPEHARCFPIIIGISEAIAIDRRLAGVDIGRPMTHDLLINTIEQLGATIDSITITKVIAGTFYAEILLLNPQGIPTHIDARPSDAIAIAVTSKVPIYAEEEVLALTSPPIDGPSS
ncbi:MAG: bifunctional nuclease family protein [Phycisphaerales bacterium]